MSDLDQLLEGVDGYLHGDEPAFLSKLASEVTPPHCIVEVGSFRGRSTIALAHGAPDGVIVYAVDPHEEHEVMGLPFGMADNAAFMENVSRAGMGHKVRVINLSSRRALYGFDANSIGLLFIDGAHDIQSATLDVHDYGALVAIGGKLAIHDSTGTWADPTYVADRLAENPRWRELVSVAYTRVFEKVAE